MKHHIFGADTTTAVPPPPPAPAPTPQQSVDKAQAKVTADQAVATDPHAVHAVNIAPAAPTTIGSAATGAGIGFLMGGPPGALVGGAIGWAAERYQIAGGPFGKAASWLKNKAHALRAKVTPPPAPVPPPGPAVPPGTGTSPSPGTAITG